jgi:YD repeat-containing protein
MNIEPQRSPASTVDPARWRGGTVTDAPPLRVVVDPDEDLIEVVDGSGILLSLSYTEAATLVEQIRNILAVVAQ